MFNTKGFLTRYNFAYADRGTVNQVGKIALRQIKNASSEINSIAQQRINQVISQGGKQNSTCSSKNPSRCHRGRLPDAVQTARKIWKTAAAKDKEQGA